MKQSHVDFILLLDSILFVQHQQNYHSSLVNTFTRIFTLTWFQSYCNLEKGNPLSLKSWYSDQVWTWTPCSARKETTTVFRNVFFFVHLKVFFLQKQVSISKKNRDDFNFHITNFPFLCSNIPSLPLAYLSHNSSDTQGLAGLMDVLFWGRCVFPISFLGRDMSKKVWNRL